MLRKDQFGGNGRLRDVEIPVPVDVLARIEDSVAIQILVDVLVSVAIDVVERSVIPFAILIVVHEYDPAGQQRRRCAVRVGVQGVGAGADWSPGRGA